MSRKGDIRTVLCAEDDSEDRAMLKEALEKSLDGDEIYFVKDGDEMMDYLYRRGEYAEIAGTPLPSFVLLDLNMPKKDGREALREIKADSNLRRIPIVVLTTSKTREDIIHCYDMGVSGFITKPPKFGLLVEMMKTLGKYWLETVELPR